MLTWKTGYAINVAKIDAQHQHLLAMINQLEFALKAGCGKRALENTLADLVAYTQNHFATEERLMLACQYPGFESHKAMHGKLARQVAELRRRHRENRVDLAAATAEFLSGWLNDHILGQDQKIGSFLKTKPAANPFDDSWGKPNPPEDRGNAPR